MEAGPPAAEYPVKFSVEYPDRPLNRVSTGFRIFAAIPILLLAATVNGAPGAGAGAVGILFLPALLMLLFRKKYPRWWFDWNLELLRFTNRIAVYLALMNDRYPSTDEPQSVRLELPYPGSPATVSRGLPLVKWFLAIPHYIVLIALYVAAIVVVVIAWFAILFTGRYPRGIFDFVEGVIRWHNRVVGYAFVLVTDEYPPFRLSA
jgi:hypothetical protein